MTLDRARRAVRRLRRYVMTAAVTDSRPMWGSGTGRAWGCDLTEGYVKINAEYTT